jgi:phospholipid/cholesterol/gamma-HCH transport system substrate-binding protein
MERSAVRDFVVGLFVLAGIIAIGYLSISIGGFRWHQVNVLKLSAAFDETGGLAKGAPVVIGGVRIGEVSTISLQNDFRAKVELDLDPTLKLPTDTSASIVTAGVLGDRYIELQPGGDEKILKTGDEITYTESAVILERLIGQFIYGATKGKSGGASSNPVAPPPAKGP